MNELTGESDRGAEGEGEELGSGAPTDLLLSTYSGVFALSVSSSQASDKKLGKV